MEYSDIVKNSFLEFGSLCAVILASGASRALSIEKAVKSTGLQQVDHVETLEQLEIILCRGRVDLIISDIHSDDDGGLLLPSMLLSSRKKMRITELPRILWIEGVADDVVSLSSGRAPSHVVTGLSHTGLAYKEQGASMQALESHARLARRAGITVGIAHLDDIHGLSKILRTLLQVPAHSFFPSVPFEDLPLEKDLIAAVTTGVGLRIVIQPQYDLYTREVVGGEALARWTHPQYGSISPSIFMPIVNRLDLNLMLFSFVQSRVTLIQKELFKKDIAIPIAVNASVKSICTPGLANILSSKMREAEIPAYLLKLELTEELPVDDALLLSASLNALRRQGFHTSLDDFGSGFAKMNLLATMPFNEVKIDGSFVKEIDQKPSRAVISTVSALASLLNMSLVAEGIEDESSIATLRRLGCEKGQGYALSRPLEVQDYMKIDFLARAIPEAA